jgi:nucleotide-binding universal stress UspA family protein
MVPFSDTISSTDSQHIHLSTKDVHFKRILVGTDFSKPANHALNMAMTISQIFGSELFLVHAVTPIVYGDGQNPMPAEIITTELEAAKDEMAKLVAGDPRLTGLRVNTTVATSGAVDLIEQVAEEEKVDLLILGSHGASGIERLLLGSVAESVLRRTSKPVIIAGPNSHIERHPFRSILFCTDLDVSDLRAAQYASALAEGSDGRLTLLHVVEANLKIPGAKSDLDESHLQRQLVSLLPADAKEFCKPKIRIEYGSPSQVILGVAESEAASLIVVGLHSRPSMADHSPWSVLSHIIRDAKCGVLAVSGRLL